MRQWFSLGFLVWSFNVNANDFNCADECGLYQTRDTESPAFHDLCEAMDEKRKCKPKFYQKKSKKGKTKKKTKGIRIVGGDETKNAMPWMVLTVIDFLHN